MGWWDEWRTLSVLPFEGDLMQQPAWVFDLIDLAERAWKMERKRHEDAEAEDVKSLLAGLQQRRES